MKEADVGRRLLGSLLGAVAGVVVYWALLQAGIVLLAIVGAALSLGGGMWALRRSVGWGVGLGILGPLLTYLVEWHFHPWNADGSLGYFVAHLGDLHWRTHGSAVLAALFGFWFGQGRDAPHPPPAQEEEEETP